MKKEKRGRPKGSKTKIKKIGDVSYSKNGKRLGRPPNPKTKIEKVKGKRGRPPKFNKKMGRPRKEYPLSEIVQEENRLRELHPTISRHYEAFGFCPHCKLSLGSGDLVKGKKFIIQCPKCGNMIRKKNLLESIDLGERAKTKKEYLQTVNSVSWRDHVSHSSGGHESTEVAEAVKDTFEGTEDVIDLNEIPAAELPVDPISIDPEGTSDIPFDRENPDSANAGIPEHSEHSDDDVVPKEDNEDNEE